MFKAGQRPQPVHSVRERSSIWLNSPKADLPVTEWTGFWLYPWCNNRGSLTLRLTGSVIGLEVLNLSELILDSVCRKWLSPVCGSLSPWRSRWSVMKASLNSRRSVSTRTFRTRPSTDLWRSRHTKVVKYWFKVSNGKTLTKIVYVYKTNISIQISCNLLLRQVIDQIYH